MAGAVIAGRKGQVCQSRAASRNRAGRWARRCPIPTGLGRAYGGRRVNINPGWPVAVALVVLLLVTVVANRLGRLGLGRQSVVAGARAIPS